MAASAYNATISAAAVCLGCMEPGSHSGWSNATRALCGHAGDSTPLLDAPLRAHALPPGGLLSAGARAAVAVADFGALAPAGDREAEHVRHMVNASTGWHLWASYTQLYALTCTASAVVGGAVAGRRNVLLLAQFIGVLVWWLMCAAVSVEFAIAVGFADACGSPMATLSRVLRFLEGQRNDRPPPPRDLWLSNLTEHYLRDCTVPDPAFGLLDTVVDEAKQLYAALASLPKPHHASCAVDAPAIAATVHALQGSRDSARRPVGGSTACGGAGPVHALYTQAAVTAMCDDVADGFVSLFAYQLSAGLLLLLLSALLPHLWHSHHLPPFSPRQVYRAAVALLRPATWRRMVHTAASAPATALSRTAAAARVAWQSMGRRWGRRRPQRAHAASAVHGPCAPMATAGGACEGEGLRAPMLAPAAEQTGQEPAQEASVSARVASDDMGEGPVELTPSEPLAPLPGRLSNEAPISVEPLVAATRGVERQSSLYEAL